MSTNFVDEYLVKLGASVDASGMAGFQNALREANLGAEVSAAGIAGSFLKAQVEVMAGFAAIGGAAIGLVDKVAMADQSYRLFALHMYMSKDAARSLKVAMDALDEPLENLTWDKELRDRTHQLIEDQRAMAPDGTFEAQMRKVRNIRFEFTRMEVEGQYLAMHVAEDFMKALGIGPDQLLKKLQDFNDWIVHNLPTISSTIVTHFMPIWQDMEVIAKLLGQGIYEAAGAFQSLIGVLSGDESLDTNIVTLESMAKTLEHVAHAAATVLKVMIAIEGQALSVGKSGLYWAKGLESWVTNQQFGTPGSKEEAEKWFGKGTKEWNRPIESTKALNAIFNGSDKSSASPSSSDIAQQAVVAAQHVSRTTGAAPDLVWAQWALETGGFKHLAGTNNMGGIRHRVPGTKDQYAFDNFATPEAFEAKYAATIQNQHRYAGLSGTTNALEFSRILKAGGYYGDGSESDYAGGLQRYQGVYRQMIKSGGDKGDAAGHNTTIGSVTIDVRQLPGESSPELASRIKQEFTAKTQKQVQRNLSEFQDPSWGY